jgi:integrase
MLVSIARNWVRVGSDQVDRLKEFRRRLGPERSGLTDKNRAALRQFDDDGNRRRLLELPGQLFHEANERDDGSTRAAIKVQMALAIEILLNCPIRMQNLISLRFDRHILRPGGATGPTFLVLPPGEVKNDELIEFEVPVRLAAMIGTYRKIFRPRLVAGRPDDNPFLFLSSAGTRKGQGTLAQQIQQVIRKHTGLVMTPHQFRHLSAKLFLEMRPGSYELVRRLLNHKNMKTTSTFYAGLQTGPAAKLYDELLLKERERLRAADPPKPRRRRSALRISNPDVMPPRSETRGRR